MFGRPSKHHWGRYAVVCVLTLAGAVPLSQRESGWAMLGFVVWATLMHGLYWGWVRKD